jgi:hypothetical protein
MAQIFLIEPMLGAGNNIVLYVFPEVGEVSAVTGHPDHERGVILGMFLGIDQDRFVDAVELNVGDAQIIQSRADQVGKLFQPFSLEMQIAELVIQEITLFRFRAQFPAGFHDTSSLVSLRLSLREPLGLVGDQFGLGNPHV